MEPAEFNENIRGYHITDAVIRAKDFFYLIGRADYTQDPNWDGDHDIAEERLQKLIIVIELGKPKGEQIGAQSLDDWSRTFCGLIPGPKPQILAMNSRAVAFRLGSGEAEEEPKITDKGRRSIVTRLRTIDGQLYLVGADRSVGIRRGPEQWEWITRDVPIDDLGRSDISFEDLDGFGPKDLYAVGGRGDAWRYDGTTWHRIDFPTNNFLKTVCCAGNGKVYISGNHGMTFEGRGDTWRRVDEEELSQAFKDMVWYEGKVWCTNSNGLWWIVDGKLVPAEVPDFVWTCAGNLDARDGVLLVAGMYGAAFHKDGEWHELLDYSYMDALCVEEGLKHPFEA